MFRQNNLCQLHAAFGTAVKPSGCQRFPFGLVATPRGGRITTQHRCPCRTMGIREPVTPASAWESLSLGRRLQANDRLEGKVRLRRRTYVTFARYEQLESELLSELQHRRDPAATLRSKPLPALRDSSWLSVAEELADEPDSSGFSAALLWFAYALTKLERKRTRAPDWRPWEASFSRAEARSPRQDPTALMADWLSDQIWSLDWKNRGSFARARTESATLHAIALTLAKYLARKDTREDRAAAEAISITELVASSPVWHEVVKRMEIADA